MAAPGKTLNDLEPATAEMITQFLSRMDPYTMVYDPVRKEINNLQDLVKAKMQEMYNAGHENGEIKGLSFVPGDGFNSAVRTNGGEGNKRKRKKVKYCDKGEFGCHRIDIKKRHLAIVRPLYKYTTTLFNKLGDDGVKPMYLDNHEIKQYKEKCKPDWKPKSKSKFPEEFKLLNEAASEKLMRINRGRMAEGLNISLEELELRYYS